MKNIKVFVGLVAILGVAAWSWQAYQDHALQRAQIAEQQETERRDAEDAIKRQKAEIAQKQQEQERALQIARESFAATVTVSNQHWIDIGIEPRWSVEHELRINGQVIDRIKSTKSTVVFQGVKVKTGDTITARSLWLNGFGVSDKEYDFCKPWPVVERNKLDYSIVLYDDETSMKMVLDRKKKQKSN